MNPRYNAGETVTLELFTYNKDDVLTNPSGTPTITITDPDGTTVVDEDDMILASGNAGEWEYPWLSSVSSVQGKYICKFTCINNTEVSIQYYTFILGN